MIQIIRNKGERAFSDSEIEAVTGKERKLMEKLNEIWEKEKSILKIQLDVESRANDLIQKENEIYEKENALQKRVTNWKSLNNLNFNEFKDEDVKSLSLESKGFVKVLLDNYLSFVDKEKDFISTIKVLKRNSKEIKTDNNELNGKISELKISNGELVKEIFEVLKNSVFIEPQLGEFIFNLNETETISLFADNQAPDTLFRVFMVITDSDLKTFYEYGEEVEWLGYADFLNEIELLRENIK